MPQVRSNPDFPKSGQLAFEHFRLRPPLQPEKSSLITATGEQPGPERDPVEAQTPGWAKSR